MVLATNPLLLRCTQVYFAVSGLDLMGALDAISNKEAIIKWIYSLQIVSCATRHAAQATIGEGSVPAACAFPGALSYLSP